MAINVVEAYSVPNDGVYDATHYIEGALQSGANDLYFPAGDYLLAAQSDGMHAVLTDRLKVECDARARFFTDALDGNMLKFTGHRAGGVQLEWVGGLFDMRQVKVSNVVPFAKEYPPSAKSDGEDNICDAIYVDASCKVDGGVHSTFDRVVFRDVTVVAGEHWQHAGGDSGITVVGAKYARVTDSTFIGLRDLGVYFSKDETATVGGISVADHNRFVNCFHGAGAKRSLPAPTFRHNQFENCVRAMVVERIKGDGSVGGEIVGNLSTGCHVVAKLRNCQGMVVHGNPTFNPGAKLADGETPFPYLAVEAIDEIGCIGCRFEENDVVNG